MERHEILRKIFKVKIVAILRSHSPEVIFPSARAILEGGINAIEVSLNTPDTIACIHDLTKIPGIIPGIGTVTNADMAIKGIEAGAQFVVTPISKKEVIDVCHEFGKPVFSGAFTPWEIFQAYEWGADVVKVFPAETLGMKYIKQIKTPFPEIKIMPTGGVNVDNIDQWFDMGADCVGVGGSFTKPAIIQNHEWEQQSELAREMVTNIQHFLETRV
jgi:2-dehydro-3-deoxyphosphogluconate aldolase/(4S)-4-hydroxy-2-oxoglutarate aldolase